MRVAAATRPRGFEIVEVPLPDCGRDLVRVRIEACGVCGSDLHLYHGDLIAPGHTPGHEMAGVVDAVGSDVTGVSVGTRVAIEPLQSCGSCEYCSSGRDSICPKLQLYGMQLQGGFAEYVAVPARRVFPVAGDLAPEIAALAEPVAVALHGLGRGGFEEGQRVLVLGGGAIGLVTLLCARTRSRRRPRTPWGRRVCSTRRKPSRRGSPVAPASTWSSRRWGGVRTRWRRLARRLGPGAWSVYSASSWNPLA